MEISRRKMLIGAAALAVVPIIKAEALIGAEMGISQQEANALAARLSPTGKALLASVQGPVTYHKQDCRYELGAVGIEVTYATVTEEGYTVPPKVIFIEGV